MGKPLNVGIIGCGAIIAQYLATFPSLTHVRLVAVADLDLARAQAVADTLTGVRAIAVSELIEAPDIDVVLNLTIPAAHAEISLAATAAGKSVYGEKPLAASLDAGREMVDAAAKAGLRLGCAPDTVLGSGVQTARHVIDSGTIGAPIAATATMATPGHERWHPNPDFYYLPGGGPLLDMGPYYVTALVTLLGHVTSVVGSASRTRGERIIGSGPREGERVPVSTDSHVTGILTHESGALSTLIMSFDSVKSSAANIEIHGELGSMLVPDPNHFAGDTQVFLLGADEWQTVPPSAGITDGARGIGLDDMAAEIIAGATYLNSHRANGDLAFHVLDVMESLLTSAHEDRRVTVSSTAVRPAAVPYSSLDAG
ncbi:Gfo/Idh/MocA family protein [Lysinibacter cavernae]|uniref:Putative dehydrogenase n=1 Tax=Lysinibacter cavernae TaxID=1640652 RepID=A0A7X5R1L1_9MICO|nr:putative dehydrogenase [Lysinibacter cavernae]